MANQDFLKRVRVKVPNLSGFDKSFRNLFTGKVGTLIPILTDELIPGTKVNLKMALQAQLPPLASDTYLGCKIKCEAFFVPNRLLYGSYTHWLMGEKLQNGENSQVPAIPVARIIDDVRGITAAPGSLADYLGIRVGNTRDEGIFCDFNIFPFLAYHRIYDDWYRNTKIQKPVFQRPFRGDSTDSVKFLPYTNLVTLRQYTLDNELGDGVKLGELRQRNFGSDYFTEAYASPQLGDEQKVQIDDNDEFSISALRAANSIQQWLERKNIAGYQWQDFLRAGWGANLSEGVAQRSIYLGSQNFDIYTRGVEQTNSDGSSYSQNPFGSIGTRYGNAHASDSGFLTEFIAQEPGYLMVLCSLVPHVAYSTGVLRQNLRYTELNSQVELATPMLQNVGMQPIYQAELYGGECFIDSGTPKHVMGYTDRFADYMTREDEVHGEFVFNRSLASFVSQRFFQESEGQIVISDAFLQIPTNYLDNVTAYDSAISEFGYWCDCFFDYKVAMPLQQYSMPSLQDPAYEHGKNVDLRRNGSRL